MKSLKSLILGILVLLLMSSCAQNTDNELIIKLEPTVEIPAYREYSRYQASLTSTAQDYARLVTSAPVYEGEIAIDPSYQLVTGTLQAHYLNNETVPLPEIYFRLFPNSNGGEYTIESVKIGGEDAAWELTSQDTALRIDLPQPLEIGDELNIELAFSLSIPTEMGGNYQVFGYDRNIMALDNLLPSIPVYNENGWYTAAPARNGDLPFVDASFYHLTITAPEELVIVSSGVETVTETNLESGLQTVEIIAGPIRDFYLSASPDYSFKTANLGEIAINIYTTPGADVLQDQVLDIAQNALTLFGEHFGPYPYTEFDIAASPVSSAMEYSGIIAVGTDTLAGESNISTFPEILTLAIVHETAHQWFYNMVGNDQINQPWLDESFAQYLVHLYFQEILDSSSFDIFIGQSWYRINREEIPIGLPVSEYRTTNYSPIIYSRGMQFLVALENELGQDLFAEVMRDYFQTNLWQIAGPDDFRNTAEAKCDCDLSALWDEWILPQ